MLQVLKKLSVNTTPYGIIDITQNIYNLINNFNYIILFKNILYLLNLVIIFSSIFFSGSKFIIL